MKDLLIGFLSKTLNMDADRIADILYKKADDGKPTEEMATDALDKLLAADVERVNKLKSSTDTETPFNNGYKKAQKEVAEQWEKKVRELFDLQSDAQGDKLLTEAKQKAANVKLDEDKIKLSPVYLALEEKLKTESTKLKETYETQLAEMKSQFERKEVLGSVTKTALEVFDTLKPVLSQNPTVAAQQRADFARLLESYEFEQVDGKYLPKKDGKRLEDGHGNIIPLELLVKQEASRRFDFAVQDPKGSAGNANGNAGNATAVKVPRSQEEFGKMMWNANTPEERAAIQTAWEKAGAAAN